MTTPNSTTERGVTDDEVSLALAATPFGSTPSTRLWMRRALEAFVQPRQPSAQGGERVEIAEYQYRMRPTWEPEGTGWTPWEKCSADSYDDHARTPLLHGWQYEVRKLYVGSVDNRPLWDAIGLQCEAFLKNMSRDTNLQTNNEFKAALKGVEAFIGKRLPDDYVAPPPAGGGKEALSDAERLDFLQSLGSSYGFEDMHEGNRWTIDGPFMTVRDALDAAIRAGKKG